MHLFSRGPSTVGSTVRLEAYSDAVIAIILTILVLELHVPELDDMSLAGVLASLRDIAPQLISFAFSFLTISVFWVNHHHFFHEVDRVDGRLLWYNNLLLFWMALIPFTTAFLGDHPAVPGVVMLYCFVLCMSALSFSLLLRHAQFVGKLVHHHITPEQRAARYSRGWVGVILYALATAAAPFFLPLSLLLAVAVPVFYIAPRLMHDHEAME